MRQRLLTATISLSVLVGTAAPAFSQSTKDKKVIVLSNEAEAAVPLDALVGGKEVWGMSPSQVEAAFKEKGFAWLDETAKDRAIIRPRNVLVEAGSGDDIKLKTIRHKMTLFGNPAYEATVEFAAGKLSTVSISIWNKGDAEQKLSKEAYEELVKKSATSVDVALKTRGRDLGMSNAGAARLSRWRWDGTETLAQLESSAGRDAERFFAADFIRLRLVPKGATQLDQVLGNTSKLAPTVSLVSRIKKSPDGDVYVEGVPMVDQGEKGYCAVASAERVMRYYGIQVDQHELAKAAETSQYGTSPADFEDALHKLQGRFKIRVKDLISFDQRDYVRMIENYNREAKKVGGRQWQENMIYFEFNPDIMREARCRSGAYEKFRAMITGATSRGMPLLWALTLGRYPETGHENPQGGGGHMRTIIGYNDKTDEIIFTDSWGAGHEMKRMKGRDACAATLGLYLVEPAR